MSSGAEQLCEEAVPGRLLCYKHTENFWLRSIKHNTHLKLLSNILLAGAALGDAGLFA